MRVGRPSDEQLLNEPGEAVAATDPVPDHVLVSLRCTLAAGERIVITEWLVL